MRCDRTITKVFCRLKVLQRKGLSKDKPTTVPQFGSAFFSKYERNSSMCRNVEFDCEFIRNHHASRPALLVERALDSCRC